MQHGDRGSPAEHVLHGIWADVLGVPAVGPDADFFAIGGNSLLAMRVAACFRKAVGTSLPLSALFRHRTLRALSNFCDEDHTLKGAIVAFAARTDSRA